MKVGIIVYSQTGHTLSVALQLKDKLSAAGHAVTLEQLETVAPAKPGEPSPELKTMPAVDSYEALVFCSPAWGGVPAPPMIRCLEQIPSLHGKKVACLVTGVFPAGWGRNQTIANLQATCESKGATICGSGSVRWWSLNRKRQIEAAIKALSDLF